MPHRRPAAPGLRRLSLAVALDWAATAAAQPGGNGRLQLHFLDVAHLDYHVASHYHADHIGCTRDVLARHPVRVAAFDRGTDDPPLNDNGSPTATYQRYDSVHLTQADRDTIESHWPGARHPPLGRGASGASAYNRAQLDALIALLR